jgi:BTB/POZ domain
MTKSFNGLLICFCQFYTNCKANKNSAFSSLQVILSACSPFFRQILRRNPHQHPLLYLKGVKYKELLSVLNFMYQGEVNVAQEELNSFLAVAEDLRVKENDISVLNFHM